MVTFPAMRKPPVVASLVEENPFLVRLWVTLPASSWLMIARISFIGIPPWTGAHAAGLYVFSSIITQRGPLGYNFLPRVPARPRRRDQFSSSSFSTAMNASVGICTLPSERIFFLPSFCFSSSFFFRVMSPP